MTNKKTMFVIVGGVLCWTLGFSVVLYAASLGAKTNFLHAIIAGNIFTAVWFLIASAINIGRL